MDEWHVDSAWYKTVRHLIRQEERPSRNGPVRERVCYSLTLLNPDMSFLTNPVRKASRAYASAELLWYLSGTTDATLIRAYAPSYELYLDDGINAYGAYGARWREEDQLASIYDMLATEPDTRQAVLRFWRFGDLTSALDRSTKDLPCTLAMQFLIRDGALHAIVTMRSNDAWLGFPYDVWCFCQLQRLLASALDVQVGLYRHQVGSMHLYEKHFEKACEAVSYFPHGPSEPEPPGGVFDMEEFDRHVQMALELEREARILGGITEKQVIDAFGKQETILSRCVRECDGYWRAKG